MKSRTYSTQKGCNELLTLKLRIFNTLFDDFLRHLVHSLREAQASPGNHFKMSNLVDIDTRTYKHVHFTPLR
uniref:Uncharacterized protein n=1 Tax=Anopheles quadriannulatus TaxID=34691 RepID=A0A182XTC4_ANOQN